MKKMKNNGAYDYQKYKMKKVCQLMKRCKKIKKNKQNFSTRFKILSVKIRKIYQS